MVAEEERLATLEAGEEEAEGEEPEVVGGEGEGVEEGPRRTLGWCTHTHSLSHTLTLTHTHTREREREKDSTILLRMQARRSMVCCRR